MRYLILLLLPAILFGQVKASHEVVTKRITEYKVQGKLVSINKTEAGKTTKLTVLDAEFTELAKGKPVDTDKSMASAVKDMIATAKKNKTVIELTNDKGQKIKFDLQKENETSVYNGILASLKNGYKKPESTGNGKQNVNKQNVK
jgi:hypothetical protein